MKVFGSTNTAALAAEPTVSLKNGYLNIQFQDVI